MRTCWLLRDPGIILATALLAAYVLSGSSASSIPIIDLSETDRLSLARAIGSACQEIGFFAVINHRVNKTTIDRAWNSSRSFFDLPVPEKLKLLSVNQTVYPYGYEQSERLNFGKTGIDGKDVDKSPTDLKQTFSIGPHNPDAGMPPRRFPKLPLDFQSALEDYYVEMELLAQRLLRMFAIALDLPEAWFEEKLTHHLSALRVLNYDEVPVSAISEGAMRASEHTDYGALTILKSGGPGLQVKKDTAIDEWLDVPTISDAFIINIGDMMQRWTNDKWVSTLHRVIVDIPHDHSDGFIARRQSIAFFCQMNGDAIIEPLDSCGPAKYPPISARDHVMNKHLASMGIVQDEL